MAWSSSPTPLTLPRAALAGIGLGAALAQPLLGLAWFGGAESGEAAVLFASVLAMPATLAFDTLDWGHYATQWTAFISVALPANGLVLGLAAGAVARLSGSGWRRWAGAVCVLWLGAFLATYLWASAR